MYIHKRTISFIRYRMSSRVKCSKPQYIFLWLVPFLIVFGILALPLWSILPWKWVSGEKITGRKKIQKDDEDILIWAGDSLLISEFAKRGVAWVRRLNASEIYSISTTVIVDFTVVVDMVITILDAETNLLDIGLAAGPQTPLLSLFAEDREHEILNHPDEVRKRVAQSSRCEVKVLTSAGFMEMNPAIVKVQLQRRSKDQTQIEIQGISKEGWIRQHAGEKAARSIAQRIEEQLSV